MIFLPAIDLKDGQCVRLFKGNLKKATIFNDNPANQAKAFQDAGCKWIHVVDLNGAFKGRPINGDAIESIIEKTSIPIDLRGAIRNRSTIEMWLAKGVSRVVLGTTALNNPNLVREACQAYPHRIAVSVDTKDGKVAIDGWSKTSEITALELAQQFEDAGVAVIIFTDIERDGVMKGPNIEATLTLASKISIPVILSGGISSMKDLRILKHLAGNTLEGVICGRAIYDGHVDPSKATILMSKQA